MARVKRYMVRGFLFLALTFILIQFVPYGWHHTNPPLRDAPAWPSDDVEQLARRACYDCHSHETNWPWYASVAPMSWVVTADVEKGRARLNFSDWARSSKPAHDRLKAMILGRHMPPRMYVRAHPEAELTDSDRDRLADVLERLSDENEGRRRRRGGERPAAETDESETGRRRGGRDRERIETKTETRAAPPSVGDSPPVAPKNGTPENSENPPPAKTSAPAAAAFEQETPLRQTPGSSKTDADAAADRVASVPMPPTGSPRGGEATSLDQSSAAVPHAFVRAVDPEELEGGDADPEEGEEADRGAEEGGSGRGRGRRRGGRGEETRGANELRTAETPLNAEIREPRVVEPPHFVGPLPPPVPAPTPRIVEQRTAPRPVEEESGRGRGRGRNRGGRGGGGRDH